MKNGLRRLACALLTVSLGVAFLPSTSVKFNFSQVTMAASAQVGTLSVTDWLEGGAVEWTPASTSGVAGYKVTCDGTTLDDRLIRRYNDGHFRADIIGVTSGSHTVVVSALNSSGSVIASESATINAVPNDRTGFAFSPKSKFSSMPGAYNENGTPKSGANIIYITKASDIDTVTENGVTGLSSILQGRNKRTSDPLIVRIIGKIDYSGSQLNSSGYIQVKPSTTYNESNITIEGVGPDTTINFGFLLRNAGNVEVRNLALHDFKDDGISLDTANTDIWVHNNEIFYGIQGSGDKAKGDGSTDVKNDSQFVTLSYNHYWDGGKVSLCGMKSESGDNYITYHHNWFDHSDSRHPRIRTMSVHIYNNYYDGNSKYGVGASEGSSAFVENNYFRGQKYPTLQGSVGCDSDGNGGSNTLEDSNPIGAIKMYGNFFDGYESKWSMDAPGSTEGNGDACLAATRNQKINYTTAAGAKYNEFDTDTSKAGDYIQSLSIESAESAKNTVTKYAGRVGGVDFTKATGFVFTTAKDTSHDIDAELRTALTNYSNNTSIGGAYVIANVGGGVSEGFTPVVDTTVTTTVVTEQTTEATTKSVQEQTTEATTKSVQEQTTEATTASQSDDIDGIKVNYNNGYTFSGNGYLSTDSSYGGAYFETSNKNNETFATSNNNLNATVSSGKVYINDDDSTYTANVILPIPKVTSGSVTISGTVTPINSATGWTLVQIGGNTNEEVVGIRVDGNKKYSMRVDAGNTLYSTDTTISAGKEVAYTIVIDFNTHKAKVTVGGNTTQEVAFTRNIVDYIKFVTATGARDLQFGNVKVDITGGSSVEKGDVNLDGSVNATDVALALQYLVGEASLSSDRIEIGDMNGDGKLTIGDVRLIKNKISA